jgi:P27 family predicted phage terminase small subunit
MPRVPLTENQAWLRGTKSKAQPQAESPHTGGRPKMPKTLTPVAREKWKELIKVLSKRGTLTKADGTLLELASEAYSRWRLYVDDVHTRGIFVDGAPNQSTKYCSQMENTLARYLIQLGITPASREKAKQTTTPPRKNEIVPGSMEDLERQLAEMPPETAPVQEEEQTETITDMLAKLNIGRTDAEERGDL